MMRRIGFWFSCVLALVLTAGCAGYKLGPTNGQAAGSHSVQIEPFANKTLQPGLSEYLMMSLRKNLIQNGTYRVDTHDDGDIIVTGVIRSYERVGISFQPTDVLTVTDYEIIMTAQVVARDRITGKVIFDKLVAGKTAVRAGADLTSAERENIPVLTDDLAKKATALLVDGTW